MGLFKTSFGMVTLAALGITVFEIGHTLPKILDAGQHQGFPSSARSRTVNWSPKNVSPWGRVKPNESGSTSSSTATESSVDATSLNWAGVVQQGTSERSVHASWAVPGFNGIPQSSNSAIAQWVGLGGTSANALIQVGTITTANAAGQPSTTVFWETLPQSAVQVATVPTGALITAHIKPDGLDRWRLLLTIRGQNKPVIDKVVHLTKSQARGVQQSADWITEAPTTNHGVAPLAPVRATTMRHAKANGVPLSRMNPNSLQTIGLYSQSGQLLAEPATSTTRNRVTVNTVYGSLPSHANSPSGPTWVIQQPSRNGWGDGGGQNYDLPGWGSTNYGGGWGGYSQNSVSWSVTY